MSRLQIESITVHDANGQPYKLADACFDVEGIRRLCAELDGLRADLDTLRAATLRFAAVAVLLSRTKTMLKPEEWASWDQALAELCAALDATRKETT